MTRTKQDYYKEYRKIVGTIDAQKFIDPEEQGRALKRCSLLKPTEEIVYSNHTDAHFNLGYNVG